MTKTIHGLFDTYAHATDAVRAIEGMGIPHEDVSIVANKADHPEASEAVKDSITGTGIGATLGGVGGLLAGLGILAVPGLGVVAAAGWLATTAIGILGGGAIGGAAGGIVGALMEHGVSEDHAHVYAEGVRRGGSLVSVKVDEARAVETQDVLNRFGAADPDRRATELREGGWSSFDHTAPALTPEEVASARAKRTDIAA